MRFEWSREFKKCYRKLPTKIQQKVQERFQEFLLDEFDPTFNNHKLTGEFVAFRSINITGDYRALYRRVDSDVILWAMVGTHAQLYD